MTIETKVLVSFSTSKDFFSLITNKSCDLKADWRLQEDIQMALNRASIRTHQEELDAVRLELQKKIEACFEQEKIFTQVIENEYWPKAYVLEVYRSPWFLVTTTMGVFKVGWRKRVLVIDWENTICNKSGDEIFAGLTDQTTVGNNYIHAWSYEKAKEYIKKIFEVTLDNKEDSNTII